MQLNILYLSEDEEAIFEFIGYSLEHTLQNISIKSFVADTTEDALKILEYNNINLIVADMNINSISSYEFYDKLNLDVKFSNIPFVFLSSNEEDKEISILKGFSNFLLKPLDVDQLLKTLHDILSKYKTKKSDFSDYFGDDLEDEEHSYEALLDIMEHSNEK